jgi:single-stranded-DNA-specific exonuclease
MQVLSLTNRSWQPRLVSNDVVQQLIDQLQLHPLVAQCLAVRVSDVASARQWLNPTLDQLHSPQEILGMQVALPRIQRAINEKERIRIVTDYDVDGTTSSLILQGALRILGAGEQVDYHIPDRFKEGYGFSVLAADKAADDGIGLIITADIGVRDHDAVDRAVARGVDVIICDHHLPAGAAVPAAATAVLCPPQAGCSYPNKALAACGVSLKLAQALLADHPRYADIIQSMLKIAAIGTVADVVDLSTPENRAIVTHGLRGLRNTRHSPGLQALLDVAGVQGEITSEDLGFRLGPRINAAGRLAEATAVIQLFDERDPAQARARAQNLDNLNKERQHIQRTLVEECLKQLTEPYPEFVVLWGSEAEGWHRGVVGIVAAKVRDATHRPTAIIAVAGDEARGSVRSTPSVHAVNALDSAADLLLGYGGHPAAAGFSIRTEHLEALRAQVQHWMVENADKASSVPVVDVDAICDGPTFQLPEAVKEITDGLSSIGPCGKGNPAPRIQVNNVHATDMRPLGDKHLRFRLGEIDTVWWNGRVHTHTLSNGPMSFVGSLSYNTWKGQRTLRFTVEDARLGDLPSPPASPEGP